MNNLNKYIKWLQEHNFSSTSINTYRKIIKKYGGKFALTNENIMEFVKRLVKKLEPSTCQLYVAALSTYAKFQEVKEIDWEKIYRIIPTKVKKFCVTINEQELVQLKNIRFEESDWIYERNNLVLDFLFYSGLRVSELINIKHRDWGDNSLRIHGKGNKVRYIFLPEFLIEHFNLNSPDYLFTSTQNKKISVDNVRYFLKKRLKLSGINKWISPHTFRRSLATNLYNRGGKLETISKQLGHSSSDTTLDYIHNDHRTLYQDYSKLFQNSSPTAGKLFLKDCTNDELLAELGRRMTGRLELTTKNQELLNVIQQNCPERRNYENN